MSHPSKGTGGTSGRLGDDGVQRLVVASGCQGRDTRFYGALVREAWSGPGDYAKDLTEELVSGAERLAWPAELQGGGRGSKGTSATPAALCPRGNSPVTTWAYWGSPKQALTVTSPSPGHLSPSRAEYKDGRLARAPGSCTSASLGARGEAPGLLETPLCLVLCYRQPTGALVTPLSPPPSCGSTGMICCRLWGALIPGGWEPIESP